ncbi:chromosomal replication initiator protein DnaA [bacterium]|nr:chromosomal replication initiator protein DnaA [candidate division CSSED10-310 bacterium]
MSSSVWTRALKQIRKRVSRQIFETWFQPTSFASLSNDMLMVEVPSPVFRDLFSEKYQFMIEEVLEDVLERRVAVSFVVPAEQMPPPVESGAVEPPPAGPRRRNATRTALFSSNGNGLNPRYTFDSFVVGSSNQFAHAACEAVAHRPAKAYNPLFIYGGVGLGKTHLMHAIGHHLLNSNGTAKVLYVSSEEFTNEVITGIREDAMPEIRRKYREIDILLVDDIQFIAGKESTQEEFFHTYNALYENGKQIIISSDTYPKDLANIEERLRSRFEWGLIADIQPPTLETKIAILQKKAMYRKIELPNDVLLFIAQRIKSNIRELEGSLIRLSAYASVAQVPITLDYARHVLKDLLPMEKREITIELIQKEVAKYFDLKVSVMRSKSRTKDVARPRQIAMYLCRELTDKSLPEIGAKFGGKDHSTVIYACKKIEAEAHRDPMLDKTITFFTDMFRT